ncbi:MAG: DUF3089 domain-containing protein [Flavobacteriaceae bacterium]|nr:DUF3089 domain-containing protein [Flavobacteriaceae bacterium]
MNFKFRKIGVIFIVILIFQSCGLLKEENNQINYKSLDFVDYNPPKEPTYTDLEDWLVHPEKQSENEFLSANTNLKRADVFFIVPTLYQDRKETSWNSDVYNEEFSNILMQSSIKYQSTAWLSSANLYSPNYRQAHFRVFEEKYWKNGGEDAFEIAYSDIKRSFEVFLKQFNKGKPIIIAGHSQGAGHAKRLLKDFFDGKELSDKLIAAYLVGTKITENDFFDLELMNKPDQTGGYVTWNTYKVLKDEKKYDLTIDRLWLRDAQVTNPITWSDYLSKDYNDHKGFLWLNQKVFPNAVVIEYIDEAVNIKTPKMGFPKSLLVSFLKDYHKGDINIFWEDIRQNSILRTRKYFQNQN